MQALLARIDQHRIEDFAGREGDFPAEHRILGAGIAGDVHVLDVALVAFFDRVGEIHDVLAAGSRVGACLEIDVAFAAIHILERFDVGAHAGGRVNGARLELGVLFQFARGEDFVARESDLADVIERPFIDRENDIHFLAVVVEVGLRHLGIDVAVVLVILAQRGDILLNLVGIHVANLGFKEIEDGLRLGLDDLAQLLARNRLVALEEHLADDHLAALGDIEDDVGLALLLVDLGGEMDVHVGVAVIAIVFEDLLLVGFESGLVEGIAGLGGDFLANARRLELGHAVDHDILDLRLGRDHDDDLHAIGLRFAENADIGNIARGVKRTDIFLHRLLRVGLSDLGAHVGQDLLLTDRRGPRVLDIDGTDDRSSHRARPGLGETGRRGENDRDQARRGQEEACGNSWVGIGTFG